MHISEVGALYYYNCIIFLNFVDFVFLNPLLWPLFFLQRPNFQLNVSKKVKISQAQQGTGFSFELRDISGFLFIYTLICCASDISGKNDIYMGVTVETSVEKWRKSGKIKALFWTEIHFSDPNHSELTLNSLFSFIISIKGL